jgi:hypothetical protein
MNPQDSDFVMRLQSISTQMPTILVILAGFYVSWASRRRHPQVAAVTAAGMGFLLVALIGSRIMPYLAAMQEARDVNDVLWRMFVIGIVSNGLSATGIVLLLWAVFGWRRPDKDRT